MSAGSGPWRRLWPGCGLLTAAGVGLGAALTESYGSSQRSPSLPRGITEPQSECVQSEQNPPPLALQQDSSGDEKFGLKVPRTRTRARTGPGLHRMLPVCVQFCGERVGPDQVQWVCAGLDRAQLVSLRGCLVSDQDFRRICESVGRSKTLVQLNLSLGVVSSPDRTENLAEALLQNRSLQTLFLHGTPLLGPESLVLTRSLVLHPALLSLDLGDCSLSDQVLNQVCGLLPPDGAKPGLQELSLSSNPGVSAQGWTRLCVALAHSSQLRVLRLDYNPLGDRIAEMLAVAVASSRTLETLDLEGTELSNHTGQVFLDLLLFYPVSLKVLVLAENRISPEVQTQIQDLLSETKDEPIRDQRLQQQPIREERDWLPHTGGAHTVLLTSGLGDSLLDETEM